MKKVIKLSILVICLVFVIGFVVSLVGYKIYNSAGKNNGNNGSNIPNTAYTNFMKESIKTVDSTAPDKKNNPEHNDGTVVLKLNEKNASSWIGSNTLSSYKELCSLYADAWRTLRSYPAYEPLKRIDSYFYVKILNKTTPTNLFIHAAITFNVSGYDKLERNPNDVPVVSIEKMDLSYEFVEGTKEIATISDSLTLGEYKELKVIASSINSNGGLIYIPFMDGTKMNKSCLDLTSAYHYGSVKVEDVIKYDKSGNVSDVELKKYTVDEVNALCDSIFVDLFEYRYLQETNYADGRVWTVSQDGINSLNDGSYLKELGDWGYGDTPIHDLWVYVESQQIFHNAWSEKYAGETLANDTTNNFVLAFNMVNETTTDEIIFYLRVEFDKVVDESSAYDMQFLSLYAYQNGVMTYCPVGKKFNFENWRDGGFEETYLIGKTKYGNDAVGVDYFGHNIALNETDICDEIIRCCFEKSEG